MDSIVIAGNGPSVQNINYKRLPKNFDSYRINQFYFEDKYYLGKEVTYAAFITDTLSYTAYMHYLLEQYSVYHIHQSLAFDANKKDRSLLKSDYPYIDFYNLEHLNRSIFAKYLAQKRNFFGAFPNIGTAALMDAIIKGYNEIYLVGIDFYNSNSPSAVYAYSQNNRPILQEVLDGKKTWLASLVKEGVPFHTSEMEKEIIQLCAALEGIKIYSIVDDCSLNHFLPLAAERESHFHGIEDKPAVPEVQDWSLSPYHQYLQRQEEQQRQGEQQQQRQKGRIQDLKRYFYQRNMQAEWQSLRENIYLRLVYQALKLPWIFLKFLIKKPEK